MKLRIRLRSWLFLIVGLLFTGIEVYGCAEYLLAQQQWRISYLVVLGAAVTGAASFIPMAIEMAWRDGRYLLALLVLLAFPFASATIFLAAVERTGSARDVTVQAQLDHATKMAALLRAERDAKADADADEAAAAKDCATGRKAICQGLEARAENARQRLAAARLAVVAAGSPPLDAQARRIAAMLPLTELQVQLYGPLILPLTGSILGVLFLAVGGRMERIDPPTAPPLELPKTKPIGNVARFMVECLPANPDRRVEIVEAFTTYRTWCSDENYQPLPAADFRADFLGVCRRAKIATKREGGKLYCEGRMLAA